MIVLEYHIHIIYRYKNYCFVSLVFLWWGLTESSSSVHVELILKTVKVLIPRFSYLNLRVYMFKCGASHHTKTHAKC